MRISQSFLAVLVLRVLVNMTLLERPVSSTLFSLGGVVTGERPPCDFVGEIMTATTFLCDKDFNDYD